MKRVQINIRVTKELKDVFYDFCSREGVHPSSLIRGWMETTVKEDGKKKDVHAALSTVKKTK